MKFLAFILSIYILALNFSPCEDNNAINDEVKTEITKQVDDGHVDLDLCSPFCQCHCCHIHATYFSIADLNVTILDIPTELFFHFYGLEKDFNNSILQPPRV
jgi:hypothetical protein